MLDGASPREALPFDDVLIKPGLSFKEFGEKCWQVPDEYVPNRYMMMIHGAGMVDEFPTGTLDKLLKNRLRDMADERPPV